MIQTIVTGILLCNVTIIQITRYHYICIYQSLFIMELLIPRYKYTYIHKNRLVLAADLVAVLGVLAAGLPGSWLWCGRLWSWPACDRFG